MTEQEARTKTCLFYKLAYPSSNGKCITSACMKWRWEVVGFRYGADGSRINVYSDKEGYCGLGGKP